MPEYLDKLNQAESMKEEKTQDEDTFQSYPFGVYKCDCGCLFIWYPDSKNKPENDFFPDTISCECGSSAKVVEKKRIKFDEIDNDLVPLFLDISSRYQFTRLMMIDAEHVHLVWNSGRSFI